jgi:hypothetical protein
VVPAAFRERRGAGRSPGAQGPPGVQSILHVTSSVSVAPQTDGIVTAECPSGQRGVSGGFSFGGIIGGSFRSGAGWSANGYNDLMTPINLTVFAYGSPNITG